MTITLTGTVTADDIKEIAREHLGDPERPTLWIEYESFKAIQESDLFKNSAVYMLPSDLEKGFASLWGASVGFYFPQDVDKA